MQSRFFYSPKDERRGAVSRVVGAILFCFSGAIAAETLYPHTDTDGHSENGGVSGSRYSVASTSVFSSISDRSGTRCLPDGADYASGPIPQPSFATTQPVVASEKATHASADEEHSASAVDLEKPSQTKKEIIISRRREANQNTPYREQASYRAGQDYWNPWGWGYQFGRPGQSARR
jgi:hypothetical protein